MQGAVRVLQTRFDDNGSRLEKQNFIAVLYPERTAEHDSALAGRFFRSQWSHLPNSLRGGDFVKRTRICFEGLHKVDISRALLKGVAG
jgi:hypothetical protein